MRHVIAYENALVIGDQFIVTGALELGRVVVPVTWGFEWHSNIGTARNLDREDDGAVTVDVDLLPAWRGKFQPEDVGCSFSSRENTIENHDGVMVVLGGKIVQIAITSLVPWNLARMVKENGR